MNLPDFNKPIEILIVEDSRTQAEQLRHVLEKNHYSVLIARNGREALDLLQQRKPTLIISDVMMPEMNGFELCHCLRADESLQRIPFILLTSLSNPDDVIKGLECGADNFITKPYEEKYLLSRIQSIFANWHLRNVDRTVMGIEVYFAGKKHFITSDRLQILNLLLSTYEAAVLKNEALAMAREELHTTNNQLALRTSELEHALKELEAFSYSVSHDLRAPLRSIHGFSQALIEDCWEGINPEGKDYLQRIAAAVSRMDSLIDDLLKLFRVTGNQITRARVDLSSLASSVIQELRQAHPERNVDVTIAPGMFCEGDEALLRIMLQNLLGNAWKFTAKSPAARIEFSSGEYKGSPVYFVRDNGAGFDMVYANKLFTPFQRLHSADDYPGTGIGLATVKRIVERHGGDIWAQSSPGHGATFYFSIL